MRPFQTMVPFEEPEIFLKKSLRTLLVIKNSGF